MTNSAHDDISIIDENALAHIHKDDERKLFTLIKEMQESEKLGAAQFMRQKIQLEFEMVEKEDNLFIALQTNMALEKGWLDMPLGALFNSGDSEQSNCLSEEDIKAIENGDFIMELSLQDESEALSLTKLLQNMDVFEVGRPSTAASIIETLMHNSELINIVKEGDKVEMTEQGRETYAILQEHLGDLATLDWNSHFISQLSKVESGEIPPDIPIFAVFERLYGKEERESLQHLSWTNPDDLYQASDIDAHEDKATIGKIAIEHNSKQS
jgi:DNA topoisomerase IA